MEREGKLIPVDFQAKRRLGEAPLGSNALSQAVTLIVETERSLVARGLSRSDPEYFTEMINAQKNSSAYNILSTAQQDEVLAMAERILTEEKEK